MRLYVTDSNNQKVYLNLNAGTRSELAQQVGGTYFSLLGRVYSIHDVRAEKSANNLLAGLLVGGSVGALGGPVGIIAGGLLGVAMGTKTDEVDAVKVIIFNKS